MGYGGNAAGLLDAETNLKYAVKYLRGAYVTAGYNSDGAVRFSRGAITTTPSASACSRKLASADPGRCADRTAGSLPPATKLASVDGVARRRE